MTDTSGEQPGEQPDLLAQATTTRPMTHAPRSSRHRRRRSGPSTPLIVGIVVVVIVVAAAAVIILTHKSSTPTAASPGELATDTWTYHDLNGHSVTVVASADVKFVNVDGTRVPEFVNQVDKAAAKHDCTSVDYVYISGKATSTSAGKKRPDEVRGQCHRRVRVEAGGDAPLQLGGQGPEVVLAGEHAGGQRLLARRHRRRDHDRGRRRSPARRL